MLKIDCSALAGAAAAADLAALAPDLDRAQTALETGRCSGGEFLGWLRLPRDYDRQELARIQAAAEKIRAQSRALVVIGIGGSYLGARAGVELLRSPYYNLKKKESPDIFFTGNTLSAESVAQVLELVRDRDFSVNVISKSGTTTEPAVAFRLFRALLEEKYGKAGARERIYATTDKEKGALKSLADREGYETFVVPDDIGGRYSVLTAVGLLPMAVTGIDVRAMLAGAAEMMERCARHDMENPAWQYAAARTCLGRKGKCVELLAAYEPAFRFFGEWWKQLFGESEGKDGKGIFPASAEFTADLHSMGQYIQDGQRLLFETVVRFREPRAAAVIPYDKEDGDGLNFLAGRDLRFVNEQAMAGTRLAHVDGGVPNLLVEVPAIGERWVGQLIYFFELSCALSGLLAGVNPFDQPGVEAYKSNMYALLGKPGHEARRRELEARL